LAERRQITVVFCDLASSTQLSTELDPEDLRDVVREFQRIAGAAVAEHDGHIAQHLGDGILIYFGYPRAHEDDPIRAAHAALRIVASVQSPDKPLPKGIRLSVRVGIHTGPVVVGAMGEGDAEEQLAVGETPNLAARLQQLAAPGTVLVSDRTARRIRQLFDLEPLDAAVLKGFATPQPLFRVVGPRHVRRAEHADTTTPFVGREAEVSALKTAWDHARAGRGRSVMVRGEPGVGKSRLVSLIGDWVSGGHERELHTACSAYTTHTAMLPLIELVGQLAGWNDGDPPAEKIASLERLVADAGLPKDATPLLLALVGLGDHAQMHALPQLSPQARTQRTIAVLTDLFVCASRRTPLAICIEDLHWVDDSTIDVLGTLIDRVPAERLLLVLTCRQQFEPPWQVDAEVNLHRLPREAVERIILHTTGGRTLPPEVTTQIVLKADGNPLFVEELTRMVVESGLLVEGPGGTLRQVSGMLPSVAIPATLHDSLMARLDRLSPSHRALVQLCATVGRQFSYELIQEIVRSFEEDMQNELRRLTDGELLYQRGAPPRSMFMFRHALIQETAYTSLLHRTRVRYHGRVADVLLARFPDTPPEVLAHHLTEAGRTRAAIAKWQEAGQAALGAFALSHALTNLQRGLSLLEQLPPGPERIDAELGLRVLLNAPLMLTQGFASPDLEANCTRVLELCESGASAPQSTFPALWGLWTFSIVGGDHARAQQMGERLLALAAQSNDAAIALAGHTATGAALLMRGRFDAAIQALETGLALYRTETHASLAMLFGQDPGAMCASFLVWATAWSGHDERAEAHAQRALAICDSVSHPGTRAFTETVLGIWCCVAGDFERARRFAETAIRLGAEQGMPNWDAQGRITLGWALSCLGDTDAGVTAIRAGISMLSTMGARATMTVYRTGHVLAELSAGSLDGAREALAEGIAYGERSDERLHEAGLYAAAAQLALATGGASAVAEAESHFLRARQIARAQGAAGVERQVLAQMGAAGVTVLPSA
jgi:predicted ATPase/class 3 adenylate cyclase